MPSKDVADANARHPLGPTLRAAWRLGYPYFRSEERWIAAALLIACIALNLALVGTTLLFTRWQGAFYNALEAKNWNAFIGSLLWWHYSPQDGFTLGFAPILGAFVLITVYELYVRQVLQIRWRRWLTQDCTQRWLANRTYFRMSLVASGTDNPDQRIAEDIRLFVDNTLLLGPGLIRSAATLVVFIAFLWGLSAPTTIFGLNVPGYLVWIALAYAGLGTWFAHAVGRRLTPLHFIQQKVEADFRFALMRLTQNAEGIALHRGEAAQEAELSQRFLAIATNWRAIITVTRRLMFLTTTYGQVILVFPFLVIAPAYFSGALQLGAIFQASNSFAQVQTALSWIVTSYADLTTWLATVDRLAGFRRSVEKHAGGEPGPTMAASPQERLEISGLSLALPDGHKVLQHTNLSVERGERLLITGPNGSGKSLFLRALAGIWPFGSGSIRCAGGTHLFMPQRAYVPIGTLKQAACYPAEESRFSDAEVTTALSDLGLAHLSDQLTQTDAWDRRLSGGELQRLVLARVLLIRPDWLFLDEATSALDSTTETHTYSLILERLPQLTLVSVAHRTQLARFHTRVLRMESGAFHAAPELQAS